MSSFFTDIWERRSRPSFASYNWLRAWAKRIRLSRSLLLQIRIQSALRRRGAAIGRLVHMSSIEQIEGKFERLSIGDESSIGRVDIRLDDIVTIGSRVCINDGVRLLTASHIVRSADWRLSTAPIIIEDYVWVAIDAIILPGVKIARGAVVGAGAVVSNDVPAGATVVGNPATVVSTGRPFELTYAPAYHSALFNAWLNSNPTCGGDSDRLPSP